MIYLASINENSPLFTSSEDDLREQFAPHCTASEPCEHTRDAPMLLEHIISARNSLLRTRVPALRAGLEHFLQAHINSLYDMHHAAVEHLSNSEQSRWTQIAQPKQFEDRMIDLGHHLDQLDRIYNLTHSGEEPEDFE